MGELLGRLCSCLTSPHPHRHLALLSQLPCALCPPLRQRPSSRQSNAGQLETSDWSHRLPGPSLAKMSSPPSPDSPPLTTASCVPSQQMTSSHPIVPAGTLVTLDPTCLSPKSHQSLTPPLPYCCTPRNPGCPLPPRAVVPSPGCRVEPPGEPLQDTDARTSVVVKVPWAMTLSLLGWKHHCPRSASLANALSTPGV